MKKIVLIALCIMLLPVAAGEFVRKVQRYSFPLFAGTCAAVNGALLVFYYPQVCAEENLSGDCIAGRTPVPALFATNAAATALLFGAAVNEACRIREQHQQEYPLLPQ